MAANDVTTARQLILRHFEDTEDVQTTAQVCAGTALARGVVDPLLSRMTKQGTLRRVAPATYQLVAPPPTLPLSPDPEQRVRAGHTIEKWMAWLWHWYEGGDWQGPGNPPGQPGCVVPLDVSLRFQAARNVRAQREAEDAALLDKLLTAANGNYHRTAALADLRPIRVMLASGIDLDRIETVVRAKHDKRSFPRNPPLTSWSDLFKPVAELHARFVLAPRIVERWKAKLADPDATTDQSPVLRRATCEIGV